MAGLSPAIASQPKKMLDNCFEFSLQRQKNGTVKWDRHNIILRTARSVTPVRLFLTRSTDANCPKDGTISILGARHAADPGVLLTDPIILDSKLPNWPSVSLNVVWKKLYDGEDLEKDGQDTFFVWAEFADTEDWQTQRIAITVTQDTSVPVSELSLTTSNAAFTVAQLRQAWSSRSPDDDAAPERWVKCTVECTTGLQDSLSVAPIGLRFRVTPFNPAPIIGLSAQVSALALSSLDPSSETGTDSAARLSPAAMWISPLDLRLPVGETGSVNVALVAGGALVIVDQLSSWNSDVVKYDDAIRLAPMMGLSLSGTIATFPITRRPKNRDVATNTAALPPTLGSSVVVPPAVTPPPRVVPPGPDSSPPASVPGPVLPEPVVPVLE